MLKEAFERGHAEALARFGLKTATGLPAARIVPKGSGVRGPAPAPPMTNAHAVASPTMGERARSALTGVSNAASRVMPSAKRGLGYAALGGAGALAYGMHQQNKEDHDAHNLVYAPMQGSYMQ